MIRSILLGLALVCAVPANAATRVFTGTQSNDTPPPMLSASCAPTQVQVSFSPSNAASSGASNFGAFGASQTHCIDVPPRDFSGGVFSYDFAAGDSFGGSYSGGLRPSGTPGVFDSFVNFVVTTGTGRFLGATGFVDAAGTLDRRPTRPVSSLQLTGVLNLPAVPEPATWAMMIGGFGLVGGMARRRRNSPAVVA